MIALGKYLYLKSLNDKEDDLTKSSGGIFIQNADPAKIGLFKVLSISDDADLDDEIEIGDIVMVPFLKIQLSSNLEEGYCIAETSDVMLKLEDEDIKKMVKDKFLK